MTVYEEIEYFEKHLQNLRIITKRTNVMPEKQRTKLEDYADTITEHLNNLRRVPKMGLTFDDTTVNDIKKNDTFRSATTDIRICDEYGSKRTDLGRPWLR